MPQCSSSSRVVERSGRQEPRIKIRSGDVAYTDGPDYLAIADAYLAPLDKCQRDVVGDWAARREDGSPSYAVNILHKPRQNGKTFDVIGYELPALCLDGLQILHTAHEVKTAQKTFRQLADIFERNADLNTLVKRISRTNGKEGIYLTNGGFIEYSARSKSAGRGNTYDVLVLDEAQELNDDQLAALMPTISASPHDMRQIFFLGTPPGPNLVGSVARRQREAAMDGAPSTCMYEWSVEDGPDPDMTFEDVLPLIYETNPAMGDRISVEWVRSEYETTSPDHFWRERLGWWGSTDTEGTKISQELWDGTAVSKEHARKDGKIAFGVKFSPDGEKVALAACRYPGEDDESGLPAHVELITTGPMAGGISWLVEWLSDEDRADATAAVAIDGRRGEDMLYMSLLGAYPKQALMKAGTGGVIAASSMFFDALEDTNVTHLEGDDALAKSAVCSTERAIGQNGGWGFGGEDATPIEAAALAYWAARTTKRDPDGGCVIG